jgi:hypothetical protein
VGDKLVTKNFGTGTTGFSEQGASEPVAVCVLPGSELAFENDIVLSGYLTSKVKIGHKVAIFRQHNKEHAHVHHDMLEFPDGTITLLNGLETGQKATVLQLPAAQKTKEEVEEQKRAEFVWPTTGL